MIGAALSDTHLGFRTYPSQTDGRNTREVDVEKAWFAAIGVIIDHQPDLITIAGDLFQHPRVSNHAKEAYLTGISTLLEQTHAHIVIAGGNHDSGKTVETRNPIMLAKGLIKMSLLEEGMPRLHLVTTPKRLDLSTCHPDGSHGQKVSVSCFPYVAQAEAKTYELVPNPDADVNVLLMHAAVKSHEDMSQLPKFYAGEAALNVGAEAEAWDVIACGDFHNFTRLHPDRLAFYSGSLERTSSNIWDETDPKGWVSYDTETGSMELHEVTTREMADYDLGDFNRPPGVGAEAVNECLRNILEVNALDGAIVRFKIDGFPREEKSAIDWSMIRDLKAKCCHFYPDFRYSERIFDDMGDRRERTEGMNIEGEAVEFFRGVPEAVSRRAFAYLGIGEPS